MYIRNDEKSVENFKCIFIGGQFFWFSSSCSNCREFRWRLYSKVDSPHEAKTGKYHGHVYNGNKEVGSENVDGTSHGGKKFSKVPKKKLTSLNNSKKMEKCKEEK